MEERHERATNVSLLIRPVAPRELFPAVVLASLRNRLSVVKVLSLMAAPVLLARRRSVTLCTHAHLSVQLDFQLWLPTR